MEPADLHSAVQAGFNNADIDAVLGLYEVDAWLFGPEGPVQGLEAIRTVWTGFLSAGVPIQMATLYAVEHGDIAMLSSRWTMNLGGEEVSGCSAEVARRQADGTWKYIIDNPDASAPAAG